MNTVANTLACRNLYNAINHYLFDDRLTTTPLKIEISEKSGRGNYFYGTGRAKFNPSMFVKGNEDKVLYAMLDVAIRHYMVTCLTLDKKKGIAFNSKLYKQVADNRGIVVKNISLSKVNIRYMPHKITAKDFWWQEIKKDFVWFDPNGDNPNGDNIVNNGILAIHDTSSPVIKATHYYKYNCPHCNRMLVSFTKTKLICGECFTRMNMEED